MRIAIVTIDSRRRSLYMRAILSWSIWCSLGWIFSRAYMMYLRRSPCGTFSGPLVSIWASNSSDCVVREGVRQHTTLTLDQTYRVFIERLARVMPNVRVDNEASQVLVLHCVDRVTDNAQDVETRQNRLRQIDLNAVEPLRQPLRCDGRKSLRFLKTWLTDRNGLPKDWLRQSQNNELARTWRCRLWRWKCFAAP